MKTAFIGQRVRIVYCHSWPAAIGKEGTVLSVPMECAGKEGTAWESHVWWGVLVDVDGLGNINPNNARFAPDLDNLEPILYDGSAPLGEVVRIFNDDGTYNPDGDVPLTVVNEEEELYV